MAHITRRLVQSFLNEEVKEYAIYVIKSRSLPSIMDGMRIGARKIVYSAMTGDLRKVKKDKMPSLIGDTMKMNFHHGDSSLKNTIEQLASQHIYRYAPLTVLGQIGTLRNPDTSTASRYLEVAKSDYLKWFDMDKDLFVRNVEEGKETEPEHLYPIIPVSLLWRTNSPGFGFSYRSFSYQLDDIIDATLATLTAGSCTGVNYVQLRPEVFGIKDENIIYNQNKDHWYNVGEYSVDDSNKKEDILVINELPYNISIKRYRAHLIDLKEKNFITDFEEFGDEKKVVGKRKSKAEKKINKIHVYFPKGRLQVLMKEQFKFFAKMKLFVKIPQNLLNIIDIDGKSIVHFRNENELVEGFVQRRLKIYDRRKTRLLEVIRGEIRELEDLIKFIDAVINEKVIINKRSIEDIKTDLDKLKISYNGLRLPISRLTQSEIDKATENLAQRKDYLLYIIRTSTKDMYINDLIDFKREYGTRKINHVEQ